MQSSVAGGKIKIALITIEGKKGPSAFNTDLKLVKVFKALSKELIWVATNCPGDESKLPPDVTLIGLELGHADRESFIKRAFLNLRHEIRIISELRKLKGVDVFVFYGGYVPLLPILFTTLFLRRKTVLRFEGRSSIVLKKRMRPAEIDHRLVRMLAHGLSEKTTYSLVHRIAVEYESMIKIFELQKYRHKIALGNQYVDTTRFKKTGDLNRRAYLLGYFGRLSHEKGILEFADSLPLILKDRQDRALIVGDGPLQTAVRERLAAIMDKVTLVSWLEQEKIPDFLNDTRFVVVPSYAEGVPNIVLEAMACGTPVLATPVGGIPDVIKDGKTGFIMENNSPECIARNVHRALNHPNIEEITVNARAFIEKEYTYGVVVDRYRDIIGD